MKSTVTVTRTVHSSGDAYNSSCRQRSSILALPMRLCALLEDAAHLRSGCRQEHRHGGVEGEGEAEGPCGSAMLISTDLGGDPQLSWTETIVPELQHGTLLKQAFDTA